MIKKKISSFISLAIGLASADMAMAAAYDQTEFGALVAEAQEFGHVRVLVALGHYGISDIGDSREEIRSETEAAAQALVLELGDSALLGGAHSTGIGQISIPVDEAGLSKLAETDLALSFTRDSTHELRIKAADLDGSLDAVLAEFKLQSEVEVDIYLNVDAVSYELLPDGSTLFRPGLGFQQEMESGVREVTAQSYGSGISVLNIGADSPVVTARISRDAFEGLLVHENVRAIRPVGFSDERVSVFSPEALQHAEENERVAVSIDLRGGDYFSPKTGYMTPTNMEAQTSASEQAFDEIFSDAGLPSPVQENAAGYLLGNLWVTLSREELVQLYRAADPRILSITPNFQVDLSLSTSTMMMNMPNTWAAGYRGAGQQIIVVDSGVRKDHIYFQETTAPFTKVRNEACFGSNTTSGGITYSSICPNPDGFGDSPLNEPGAGDAVTDPTICATVGLGLCAHGTHVAGIAAGALSSGWAIGIAPDARVVAVQVFSFANSPIAATAFVADIQQALTVTYGLTSAGTGNPLTVNLSLQGARHTSDCDSVSSGTTTAIHNLVSRGVPVLAATGNAASRSDIAWPACVSQTVKVSGVENDWLGTTIYSQGNYSNPASYTGPFFLAPSGGGSTWVTSASIGSPTSIVGMQGTSQAAPHVAGIYAALKAAVPGITVADASAWIATTGSISVTLNLGSPHGSIAFRRLEMPF